MTTTDAILDELGRVMFVCRRCGDALSRDDFFELGLRLPECGEDASDYCDAELLERADFEHLACTRERVHVAG